MKTDKPTRPHHLHVSTGSDRCGNCAWFHAGKSIHAGNCAMFGGWPVRSDQVCDSYEKGKPGTKG